MFLNTKKCLIGALAFTAASTSWAQDAGGVAGGGGSEEVRTFVTVAREKAMEFSQDPKTARYSRQILRTLSGHLEIYLRDSLKATCDQ